MICLASLVYPQTVWSHHYSMYFCSWHHGEDQPRRPSPSWEVGTDSCWRICHLRHWRCRSLPGSDRGWRGKICPVRVPHLYGFPPAKLTTEPCQPQGSNICLRSFPIGVENPADHYKWLGWWVMCFHWNIISINIKIHFHLQGPLQLKSRSPVPMILMSWNGNISALRALILSPLDVPEST